MFPERLQQGYRAFVEGRLPRERERFAQVVKQLGITRE